MTIIQEEGNSDWTCGYFFKLRFIVSRGMKPTDQTFSVFFVFFLTFL